MASDPFVMQGQIAVDDRGEVAFVNEFDFSGVKRFYIVSNYRRGFVRAWHGHKKEAKYVTAVRGSFLVCCIKIDNWDNPSPDLQINRYVLSERQPAVLRVPPGYVNGFMSLTENGRLMFFATSSLEQSLKDDFRFSARRWDPWSVLER